jgi:hypothetical protein
MMNDPVIVWPPGTFYLDCGHIGYYRDCSYEHPELASQGALVCCPAWW